MGLFGILSLNKGHKSHDKACTFKEGFDRESNIFGCDDYDVTKWSLCSFDMTSFLGDDEKNRNKYKRGQKKDCFNSSIPTIDSNSSLPTPPSSAGSIRKMNMVFDFDPAVIRQRKCNALYDLNHDDSTDDNDEGVDVDNYVNNAYGDFIDTAVSVENLPQPLSLPLQRMSSPERNFETQGLKRLKTPNIDTEHIVEHYNRDRIERCLECFCPPHDVRPHVDNFRSERTTTTASENDQPAPKKNSNTTASKQAINATPTNPIERPVTQKISNTTRSKQARQTFDRPSTQKISNTTSSKSVIQYNKEETNLFFSHFDQPYSHIIPIKGQELLTPEAAIESNTKLTEYPTNHTLQTSKEALPTTMPNTLTSQTQGLINTSIAIGNIPLNEFFPNTVPVPSQNVGIRGLKLDQNSIYAGSNIDDVSKDNTTRSMSGSIDVTKTIKKCTLDDEYKKDHSQFSDSANLDGLKDRCDSSGSEMEALQAVSPVNINEVKEEVNEEFSEVFDNDHLNNDEKFLDISQDNRNEAHLTQLSIKDDISHEPKLSNIEVKDLPSDMSTFADEDKNNSTKCPTVLTNPKLEDNYNDVSSLPENVETCPKRQLTSTKKCSDNIHADAITPILTQTSSLTTQSIQVVESISSSFSTDNRNILALKTRLQEIRNRIKGDITDIRSQNSSLFSPSMELEYERGAVDTNNTSMPSDSSPRMPLYDDIPNLMDVTHSADDLSAHSTVHDTYNINLRIEPNKPSSPTGVDEFEIELVAKDKSQLTQEYFSTSKVAAIGEAGDNSIQLNIGKSDTLPSLSVLPESTQIDSSQVNYLSSEDTNTIGCCLIAENQSILKLKARLRQIEMKVKTGMCIRPAEKSQAVSLVPLSSARVTSNNV